MAITVLRNKKVDSMRFIYVKSEHDKGKMIELGFVLMKEDVRNGIWVFQSKDTKTFDTGGEIENSGIQFVLSNTLTF